MAASPRQLVPLIAIVALALPFLASADEHPSRAGAREFQREHPCPSTGLTSGACPGYWKDHIVPLACGGPTPSGTCSGKPFATQGLRTPGSGWRAPGRLLLPSHSALFGFQVHPWGHAAQHFPPFGQHLGKRIASATARNFLKTIRVPSD
jgi:hypothetical protein